MILGMYKVKLVERIYTHIFNWLSKKCLLSYELNTNIEYQVGNLFSLTEFVWEIL